MNQLEELDNLFAKPIAQPFENERDFADAIKRLFGTKDGAKVLQQLKHDMGYYAPPFMGGKDLNAQAHFNNGKRYVLHHIDMAMTVQYTTTTTNEDEDHD